MSAFFRGSLDKNDFDQNFPAVGAINHGALFKLKGNRAEVTHQQPCAEGNEERGVGEDECQARVKQAQLKNDRCQRNEQDGRRHQVGQENGQTGLLGAFETQTLNGVGCQHRGKQREESRSDRHHHRVPHPLGVLGSEQQLFNVRHGGRDDPKRIAIARQQLIVGFEGGNAHPIKRKEQHEQEQAQWQIGLEKFGGGGVQIGHAAVVLIVFAHLSLPPCCHARR